MALFDWLRRRRAPKAPPLRGRPARRLAFEGLEPRSLLSATVYEGGSFAAAALGATPANDIIVTGAESGHDPLVRVFNTSDGSERFNFLAYDAAFHGGVRVAAGDLTGDGVPDIITAAGAGGGPHIRVFDGTTGSAIASFFAYSPAFTGGVFVAAGDVTGDGLVDIITGAGAGGGPHVRVFNGATDAPLPGTIGSFFAYSPTFTGGVTVAAGDITGDTLADVITGAGATGGPHVRVFDAATGAQAAGAIGSFFAYSPTFNGGVFVAAGDANADGQIDVITGAGKGGGPHLKIFDGATASNLYSDFTFSGVFHGGIRPAAADFNGDGRVEVVVAPGDGGRGKLRTFTPLGTTPSLGGLDAFTAYAQAGAGFPQLSESEVQLLLKRAAAVSSSEGAIIAVVDRNGRILGVRVEQGVLDTITDLDTLVFAIDGAVAKARTAAFFASGSGNGTFGPLTSRTIRFISQSTVTQREVQSNPNSADPLSQGPGFVAPVGVGGRFPPEVRNTPLVDLFGIEHTNRDSIVNAGANGIRESTNVQFDTLGYVLPASLGGDDVLLPARFNIDPAFVPAGQEIYAPESYGFVSGRMTEAQGRGIATIPGGIPLFRDTDGNGVGDTLIGGIGVFFPGPDGYASHEQGFVPGIGQTATQRINTNQVLEAEFIALAAAGGSIGAGAPVGVIGATPAVSGLDLPFGRIFLVGIDLETVGPNPEGVQNLLNFGSTLTPGDPNSGADQPIDPNGTLYQGGLPVPNGWLVLPHSSPTGTLSAADVERIINQAIAEANLVRAQIRLPEGNKTRMVLSVADKQGNVLGLYRMTDATVFSIDVAVAKARNTAYYADPTKLQPEDMVDDDDNGVADLPAGVAFSNRTFRFLAAPRFPSSVENSVPGDFSILRNAAVNSLTAENAGATPASPLGTRLAPNGYTGVLAYDAFHPGTNFHDPGSPLNQNGIVFFPGSLPLYQGSILAGGWGVSGDGVDQDDVVTFSGATGYLPPSTVPRADQTFVRGVRLPFLNFPRNPHG